MRCRRSRSGRRARVWPGSAPRRPRGAMPECGVAPLRFQVLCLPNVPWEDLRSRVVRLEQLGIEVVALPEHFVDWTPPPSPWFESWTTLTGLACATTSIRLTNGVPQITFRHQRVS